MFLYVLVHKASRSFNEFFGAASGASNEDFGVAHGDDLLYLFKDIPFMDGSINTDKDRKVADQITSMWTNFAKYGDPTPYQDGDLITWRPFDVSIIFSSYSFLWYRIILLEVLIAFCCVKL